MRNQRTPDRKGTQTRTDSPVNDLSVLNGLFLFAYLFYYTTERIYLRYLRGSHLGAGCFPESVNSVQGTETISQKKKIDRPELFVCIKLQITNGPSPTPLSPHGECIGLGKIF